MKLGNTVIVTGHRRAALEDAIAGRPRMHAPPLDIEDAEATITTNLLGSR